MLIKTWNPEMTDTESKDLAYWERNMLALRYADGWYNDDVPKEGPLSRGWWVPRFDGWRRVLSLDGGKITFHIPDDFDVGNLPEIAPNWDGHTTEEKWERILKARGINPSKDLPHADGNLGGPQIKQNPSFPAGAFDTQKGKL